MHVRQAIDQRHINIYKDFIDLWIDLPTCTCTTDTKFDLSDYLAQRIYFLAKYFTTTIKAYQRLTSHYRVSWVFTNASDISSVIKVSSQFVHRLSYIFIQILNCLVSNHLCHWYCNFEVHVLQQPQYRKWYPVLEDFSLPQWVNINIFPKRYPRHIWSAPLVDLFFLYGWSPFCCLPVSLWEENEVIWDVGSDTRHNIYIFCYSFFEK